MFTREQYMELTFDQKKEIMEWRAKFHAKKAKATAEIKRIKKNGYNSFHNYHYATESDVKDEIRAILLENQLSITNDLLNRVETVVNTKNGQATKTDVKMLFVITDTETGYFEEYTHDGVTIDNSDKGIYKAYSNTIKYFLMDTFLIPTGDDAEKDAPELAGQPQGNPGNNQKPQQRQGTARGSQGGGQANDKPTWRKIMDAEDKLVQVAGTDKTQVRAELKGKFGALPKYKELDEAVATKVLAQLEAWIERYTHPID
jgi:hypothetical protein